MSDPLPARRQVSGPVRLPVSDRDSPTFPARSGTEWARTTFGLRGGLSASEFIRNRSVWLLHQGLSVRACSLWSGSVRRRCCSPCCFGRVDHCPEFTGLRPGWLVDHPVAAGADQCKVLRPVCTRPQCVCRRHRSTLAQVVAVEQGQGSAWNLRKWRSLPACSVRSLAKTQVLCDY